MGGLTLIVVHLPSTKPLVIVFTNMAIGQGFIQAHTISYSVGSKQRRYMGPIQVQMLQIQAKYELTQLPVILHYTPYVGGPRPTIGPSVVNHPPQSP